MMRELGVLLAAVALAAVLQVPSKRRWMLLSDCINLAFCYVASVEQHEWVHCRVLPVTLSSY